MPRQRTIVGIGEAIVAEHPDREGPDGLAVQIALAAQRLGHVGVPIARIGQDRSGDLLLERLRAAKLDTSHLQSDPDLPTGRLVVRSIAGRVTRTLDAQAAFDNLQWDFDLEDVAQRTDVVVFGLLARRGGQTRAVIDQFLGACRGAIRVCDLTNRNGAVLDRQSALRALQRADGAIVDDESLRYVVTAPAGAALHDSMRELLRVAELQFALRADAGAPLELHGAEAHAYGDVAMREATQAITVCGVLHALLAGWDFNAAIELADKLAAHTTQEAPGPVPIEWLSR